MAMKEPEDLTRRKAVFRARTEHYASLGFDRFAAADFVIGTGGRLSSPALDVGTGKGLTAMALARRGLEVVSVDPDADEQALAFLLADEAGLADRIRFVHGDASDLPFPGGHFGCAALVGVLHHLQDPVPVLAETARVLRPCGIVILADFSAEGLRLVARVHREEGREHAVSGATPESAAAVLSGRGFELTVRRSGHKHDVIVLTKKTGEGA
ncbi:MAG: class I SAM-dependent methyltransferase [Candidatus Aminicenantes bacterium]|nr:class I SAM-dependent methyltransferase [Candidatus Aminicenantes bacterium]